MAVLLKNSPTATSAENDDTPSRLGQNEIAASPYEEHLLSKVMGAIYMNLNNPQRMRAIEATLLKTPDLGPQLGLLAFIMLSQVFHAAEKAGVQIPIDVFFAQGGAVYQTIDRLLLIAEHSGVPNIDQDKVREDALGTLVERVRKLYSNRMGVDPTPQHENPMWVRHVLAANQVSHAVGQGLQQQGLLGGQQ